MSHRLIAASAAAALLLGVTACGGDAADEAGKAADTAKDKASQAASEVTGEHLDVVMSDFEFSPSKLDAKAGKLVVTAENKGKQEHELVLLRTNKAPDAIPLDGAQASESGSVGEIEEQEPGKKGSHTFDLKPGRYVFLCNVPGHYKAGMRGTLVVK